MAQDNMVLFAKKLKLESKWNELLATGRAGPNQSVRW